MAERMRFTGKVALVTGASSGIGRACARALAAEGAAVVLAGRRSERLDEVAAELKGEGARVHVVVGDVRAEATAAAWVKEAVAAFGGLDVLVNAAGVIGNGSVMDTTAESWKHVMSSNVDSILHMTRAAAEPLKERKGAIVNVSSVAGGVRPYPGLASYCVSKAGLDMLVKQVADELGISGVRANAVRPGLVPTDASAGLVSTDVIREDYLDQMPLARIGTEDDVASLVRFLLGPESSWITGQCIGADGGHSLRRGPNLTPLMEMALGDAVRPQR